MVTGNIGSATRFDYTALGDNVNLASRLEGGNKVYGTRILVSENTAALAGPEFVFRELDLLRVKGRRGTTRILELFGLSGGLGPEKQRGLDGFARALTLYRAGRFAEAGDGFAAADELLGGSDGPCETFIGRCQKFALHPPPADWGGVYEMTSK
jgi:adenylate cyclase